MRIEGVDALYAQCLAFGIVHPNATLQTPAWGSREFAVLDPDGNLVTFAQWNEARAVDPQQSTKEAPHDPDSRSR